MQGNISRPSHPALREGLVFGVTLGIITILDNLLQIYQLQNHVKSDMLGNITPIMFPIVIIALNLLAGVRASQWTGRVGTGALAGLIMQLIGFLFGFLLTLTKIFVFDTLLHRMFLHATAVDALWFIALSGISLAVFLLLGAAIGAIGGLIGRNRAQLPLHV